MEPGAVGIDGRASVPSVSRLTGPKRLTGDSAAYRHT